jgi:hypothetical protein
MLAGVATCIVDTANATEKPMDNTAAEALARSTWFDFELGEVTSRYHGDWLAFYRAKRAEDAALTQARQTYHVREWYLPKTPKQVRARRVLQEEFEQVAKTKTAEIVAEARRAVAALARGDIETVAELCIGYEEGPKRRQRTRDFFNAHREELLTAANALTASDRDFGKALYFEKPDPATGQVGRVHVQFGPTVTRPASARPNSYPSGSEVELWWLGQVMPEPNGKLYSSPHPSAPSPGHWRFYQLTTPYSLVHYGRE